MDYKNAFKVVSTGKRVSSLYAEPQLTVYPDTGRMRLTQKALAIVGVKAGERLTILQSEAFLAFVADEEGRCKVDKNGNFTSSATVTPLELDENTSFNKYETAKAEDIGIGEDYPEATVIIFDLSDKVTADAEEDEEDEEEAEEVEA